MIREILDEHMTFKIIHESFVKSMNEFFDITIEEIKELEAIKFAKLFGIPKHWLQKLGIDITFSENGSSNINYLSNLRMTKEEANKIWYSIMANDIEIKE